MASGQTVQGNKNEGNNKRRLKKREKKRKFKRNYPNLRSRCSIVPLEDKRELSNATFGGRENHFMLPLFGNPNIRLANEIEPNLGGMGQARFFSPGFTTNQSFPVTSQSNRNDSNSENLRVNLFQPSSNEEREKIGEVSILELVKEVCSEIDVNEENIASKFFQALASQLLSLTDSLPEQRTFIYNILSTLVNVGMRCAHKEAINTEDSSITPAIENINDSGIASSNNYYKNLHSMIDLDHRIQLLSRQRVELYSSLYKSISLNLEEPSTSSTDQNNYFDSNSLQRAILNIKEEVEKTSTSLNSLAGSSKITSSQRDHVENEVNTALQSNDSSKMDNIEVTPMNKEQVSTDVIGYSVPEYNSINHLSNVGKKPNTFLRFGSVFSTELTCFCIYEQAIFAGYKNGSILVFDMDSGNIVDNVQPHKRAITTIDVWEKIMITASLDRSLKKFDLTNQTVKKIPIPLGVICSFQYKGILYFGSSSGQVVRMEINDMKFIANPFCVAKESVVSIIVTEIKTIPLLFVAVLNSFVSMRDANTGTLLQKFTNLQDANFLMMIDVNFPLRLCAGFKNKFLTVNLENNTSSVIAKDHSVIYMFLHKSILFVASENNKIFVYEVNSLNQLAVLVPVINIPESIKCMAFWKNYLLIATKSSGFQYIEIPNSIIELIV